MLARARASDSLLLPRPCETGSVEALLVHARVSEVALVMRETPQRGGVREFVRTVSGVPSPPSFCMCFLVTVLATSGAGFREIGIVACLGVLVALSRLVAWREGCLRRSLRFNLYVVLSSWRILHVNRS